MNGNTGGCRYIFDRETFDVVQAKLKSRSPKVIAPRTVNNPLLLSGTARCESCGGKLTLRTGNGNGGNYRYYVYAREILSGGYSCDAPASVRTDALDQAVCSELVDRILTVDLMHEVLRETMKRVRNDKQGALTSIRHLRRELRQLESQIENLINHLADGDIPNLSAIKTGLSKR